MTAKEKAEELVDKIYYSRRYEVEESYIPKQAWDHAKQCALIAVDEIIKLPNAIGINDLIEYWEQVKKEIKQL
jgi:hypothetical protein